MKKKLLAFILSLALIVSCFVPSVAVSAADSVANISDSTVLQGKTLWSFDGSSVSAVPEGWELELGTGTNFWGSKNVCSLSYDASTKGVKAKAGACDGVLYFPEINGDAANFIFEVTFSHLEADSSVGLANNIIMSTVDTDNDGLYDAGGATWFAVYEDGSSSKGTGYYIRKGNNTISKGTLTLPEGFVPAVKNVVSTYKLVVMDGVTYIYINDELVSTPTGEGFADPNTKVGNNIRCGMFITNSTVSIKSATVKEIAGRSGVWDGKTTKQPTADADGDGYTDISNAFELAYVIDVGGSSTGKYELTSDIWLNDMRVEIVEGSPKVTKASTGEEITDLSSLNTWYTDETIKGEFKGNGHVVHGLFYDSYSSETSTKTRALFPTAGKGLSISGFGVEDAYITSNSSYATAAILGKAWDLSCTIDSCYAGESVYMYGDNLAGVLGGGFATNSTIKISNCYSLATLKHHDDNPKDSYGTYVVNALVGNNWGWGTDDTITNCYAVGSTGLVRSGTPVKCALVSTKDAVKIKDIAAAYNLRDIGDAYVTTEGYPTLKIFMDEIDETKNLPLTGGFAGGSGTEDDPYIIANGTQLRLCVGVFGDNKYFKFANDIYVNDITKINWSTGAVSSGYEPTVWFGSKVSDNGRSYTGFGDIESTFKGHIDGDGYALYGIYYRPYANYDVAKYGKFTTCAGLIPSFNTGSVSNLTIKNSYLASGRFAGVITADSNAQVLVTNVAADETVTITGNNAGVLNSYGKNYESSALGGMIGYIRNTGNTTLKNCSYAGKINAVSGIGSYWGLVGTHWNSKFTVIDSFSVGIAPVASIEGGIHGTTRNITVSNVYSTVTPSWFVGGGTVNGTITVVPSVTGENALSAENMANLDKTVWYAVKDSAKAPMLRIYGTTIGDVNENAKGAERDDEHALRATLIGAENYMNTDYNRDNKSNVLDLVALHNDCSTKDDDWRSHPEDFKLLAFTFDDGPDDYSPSVTEKVADLFAENNGSATFFFIGNSFNKDTDVGVAKHVLSKGSEIANHSYNHKNASTMDAMSDADFKKEFEGANELIKQHTGVTPKFWRGAGYTYGEKIYEHLEELNMPAIGSYTSLGSDWSGGTATVDGIVNVLLKGLPDGAIIGAHSSSNTYVTPNALEIALPQLYEQGYRFCTVSELLEYKGLSASDLPLHAYTTRIETLSDGSTKIHTMNRMYLDSWREHPEDYKLLAFTFDDGPVPAKDTRMVDLFTKYAGSATMFVTGTQCKSNGYESLQYAINNGWDVGNHSMTHADAHNGKNPTDPAYTELSYDELKYQIVDMNTLLESNLTMADGVTPYEVSLYRPPQIRTTETLFQICEEENMPVIWLSQNTYDWSSAYDEAARLQVLKDGVGSWIDGDVILGHITQDTTYNGLAATLEDFYDAGYRFCSITELMEYRGIERSDISGKLNEVDGNQGRVRNLVKSATYGKAE